MPRSWSLISLIGLLSLGCAAGAWAAQQGGGTGQSSSCANCGSGYDSIPGCDGYGTVLRGSSYYGGKAFLGLAAKGNIVIGDYTNTAQWPYVAEMIDRDEIDDVTQPYALPDATDETLGYNNSPGGCGGAAYCFNGKYDSFDGGQKMAKDAQGNYSPAPRKFYESSLSDTDYDNLVAWAIQDPIPCFGGEQTGPCSGSWDNQRSINIQATLYTNHAIIGNVGRSAWNGAWVARDDALRFQGRLDMVYDWRLQDATIANQLGLPMTLSPASVVSWQEVPSP